MLTISIEVISKFRQVLINEAFSLEDVELVKQINNMTDEKLLLLLLEYTDIQRVAEHAVHRVKELDLPF